MKRCNHQLGLAEHPTLPKIASPFVNGWRAPALHPLCLSVPHRP